MLHPPYVIERKGEMLTYVKRRKNFLNDSSQLVYTSDPVDAMLFDTFDEAKSFISYYRWDEPLEVKLLSDVLGYDCSVSAVNCLHADVCRSALGGCYCDDVNCEHYCPQGQHFRLPCYVGQSVYKIRKHKFPCSYFSEVYDEERCAGCLVNDGCDYSERLEIVPHRFDNLTDLVNAVLANAFGKIYFLERSAAEEALKECEQCE